MLDVASRYLLFPLKRAVADVLLPHLDMVSHEEICHWLTLGDMYFTLMPISLNLTFQYFSNLMLYWLHFSIFVTALMLV